MKKLSTILFLSLPMSGSAAAQIEFGTYKCQMEAENLITITAEISNLPSDRNANNSHCEATLTYSRYEEIVTHRMTGIGSFGGQRANCLNWVEQASLEKDALVFTINTDVFQKKSIDLGANKRQVQFLSCEYTAHTP